MKAVADCDGFLFVLYSPLINAYLCLTKDEDMDEILQWLTNGKDYQTGITLLERHQRNRMLVQHFRHSTPKFAAAKLEYELRKLLKGKSVAANQTRPTAPPWTLTNVSKPKAAKSETPIPSIIVQAKDELYGLFTAISTAHRKLYELGEGNSEDVVAQRRRILEDRLPLIRRYEKLYPLKERYFDTGKVPDELVRMVREKVVEEPAPVPTDGRAELEKLTDMELLKKEHSIKVNINTTRNRLEYQANRKLDTPNPMPESPLRSKLEAKLADLRTQYANVTEIIESRK